ncbi:MAG: hypothetical protein K7J15_04255, partial [Candidatus Regiella insecticola]|nr:hypothetical protein [Candidatus Regiella insecticola]
IVKHFHTLYITIYTFMSYFFIYNLKCDIIYSKRVKIIHNNNNNNNNNNGNLKCDNDKRIKVINNNNNNNKDKLVKH